MRSVGCADKIALDELVRKRDSDDPVTYGERAISRTRNVSQRFFRTITSVFYLCFFVDDKRFRLIAEPKRKELRHAFNPGHLIHGKRVMFERFPTITVNETSVKNFDRPIVVCYYFLCNFSKFDRQI